MSDKEEEITMPDTTPARRTTGALEGPEGIPPGDTDSEGGETDVKTLQRKIRLLHQINNRLGRKLLGRGKGKR